MITIHGSTSLDKCEPENILQRQTFSQEMEGHCLAYCTVCSDITLHIWECNFFFWAFAYREFAYCVPCTAENVLWQYAILNIAHMSVLTEGHRSGW